MGRASAAQLVPRRIGCQNRKPGFLRTAQGALEAPLQLPEISGADHPGDIKARQCHGIATTFAFDPESTFETGEIAGRADEAFAEY